MGQRRRTATKGPGSPRLCFQMELATTFIIVKGLGLGLAISVKISIVVITITSVNTKWSSVFLFGSLWFAGLG